MDLRICVRIAKYLLLRSSAYLSLGLFVCLRISFYSCIHFSCMFVFVCLHTSFVSTHSFSASGRWGLDGLSASAMASPPVLSPSPSPAGQIRDFAFKHSGNLLRRGGASEVVDVPSPKAVERDRHKQAAATALFAGVVEPKK